MKKLSIKYKFYIIIGITFLATAVIGGTYAIFRKATAQESTNVVSTLDCVDVSITGNNSALSLNNAYPLTYQEGMAQTPYRFTVENNCNTFVRYQIVMSVVNTTTITNKEYVKADLDGLTYNKNKKISELIEEPQQGLVGYLNNYTLINSSFDGDESHVYNFRMWLNGDNENIWEDENIANQSITVKLSIIGVVQKEPTLKDHILAQGGGPSAIESKGNPDFANISTTSDTGLYMTEDEYGKSYYYRGNKDLLNNNIIFGGFQWKIIRINGDGSIRLIYNGTEAQFNQNGTVNDIGINTQLNGYYAWNLTYNNDAKYVGYMYGGANGVASTKRNGTDSLAATYNETSSNVKTELNNWYQTNFFGKSFENLIVDNLFCNDRKLASGLGYGNAPTDYDSRDRIANKQTATLKCEDKNDRFALNNTIGNGKLTYPVGLITADELLMSGLVFKNSVTNTNNYLYNNNYYLSFTPSCVFENEAYMMVVSSAGFLGNDLANNAYYRVRPVISIKGDFPVTGDGSALNPYKVEDKNLKDTILAKEGGPAVIEAKSTPDFSVINGTSGLYAADDEYGKSYYFRGEKNLLNNNLIWGEFQWKIVRINGDGSIRLIYNGTESDFNTNGTVNDTGPNTQIGETEWNTINFNDAKYVGYMYGGANGVTSDSREEAILNETSTKIKTVLEEWYQANIFGKPIKSQIIDNIFCNDRELQNGPGYGLINTYYTPNLRLNSNKTPTLKCGLKNDRFTAEDTIIGNGVLIYPVGLITADEAAMAGFVNGQENTTNYLYTNQDYWTLSPYYVTTEGTAVMFRVYSSGLLSSGTVNYARGLRPTISIDSNIKVTGSGTASNPYKVI